ncbi:MAG: NAD(P)-dependent dehydrogenase (short-subunit alcohol dehydrogenase family) [Verrucomicrobiales bacterium]|jgi:NAD(P)-dependent dehydrogenase (short-subunit alcohol dehydrogenase family)
MRLNNKNATITGGGSGIGLAIAQRFANEGARVTILERDEAVGDAAAEKIGMGASFAVCDVANLTAVEETFQQLGPQDILVNNAGIAHIGNIENTSAEDFDKVLSVNVKGVYHCTRAVLPQMLTSENGGVILNLASVASKLGISERFAYSASKGAVLSMTLSIARDYVDKKIRCNCMCPARVHTPFVDGYLNEHYPDNKDEMFAKLSAYQPIGRMAEPAEIASLACFLCSDEAAFITGSAYDIDGGVTLLR